MTTPTDTESVERLANWQDDFGDPGVAKFIRALAAERDALRAELDQLRAAAEPVVAFTFADRVAAGETDQNIAREWVAIKRPLRAALRQDAKEGRSDG